MKRLLQMFMSTSELYLEPEFEFKFRTSLSPMLNELNPLNPENTITMFSEKVLSKSRDRNGSGLGLMRSLSVLHLILMHTNEQYQLVEGFLPLCEREKQANKKNQTYSNPSKKEDVGCSKFLKEKALYKYQKFLMKCCSSQEMYSQIKLVKQKCQIQYCSFELFFYVRNLFTLLMDSLSSISSLARFFMESNPAVITMFGDVGAMQAVTMYNVMVRILVGILRNDTLCLKTDKDKDLIRTIVEQEMVEIDGDIKRILLNKYYNFVRRGLTVKIFKIEEQDFAIKKKLTVILSCRQELSKAAQLRLRTPESLRKNRSAGSLPKLWAPLKASQIQSMISNTNRTEQCNDLNGFRTNLQAQLRKMKSNKQLKYLGHSNGSQLFKTFKAIDEDPENRETDISSRQQIGDKPQNALQGK